RTFHRSLKEFKRILGHNLGTSGNLIPDGPGVTYQGFTYWSPDEIDAYFNIDSTAVTQNITVSVGTDDTGNSFQQRTGDPLSQSQGTGQMNITPPPPPSISVSWNGNSIAPNSTVYITPTPSLPLT